MRDSGSSYYFAPKNTGRRGSGALGGTRTPTILLTATSRQRVYQFRHERLGPVSGIADRIDGAHLTKQ